MATNNILDLPRDQFLASLNELAAQGVNTDELMRQYRRANSPFSGFFDWAINSERDIANEGRTTAGAGLFSKEAGTTGMDALASTRIEPANFIAGLLSGGAQAVDAAGATLKGLVPAADMPMEALGTAGMAMTGGAAAPKPRGALGANSLRVYHGTDANIDRLDPAYGRTARDLYTTPIRDDAAMYGRNVLEFDVSGNIGDFRPDARTRETTQLMRKVYSEHGLSDYFDSFDEFVDAFDSGDLYQRFGNSRAQDDIVAGLLDEGGFDAVRIPDAGFGGSMSESVVARSPDVFSPVSKPAEPVAQAVENVQPSEGGFFNFPIDELSANRDATTGAIALPAARNEAERMARQILEMRAAGRAGEVTDAMMAQADPQYMFNNTPLPMDEASRMARAGDMGFDTRVYHGSRNDMTSMDRLKGSAEGGAGTLFSSDEARVANTYATKRLGSEGENVLPLLANVSNYGESGYKTPFPFNGSDIAIEQWLTGLDRFNRTLDNSKTSYFENAIRSARNAGQSGTVIRQVEDDAVSSIQTMPSDVHVTLDPTTIRSRFARFDPEFSHLANLNAANASPLAGILAMPNEEERNRQLGLLFGGYR